ncbi:MAG: integrase core domain-containing protein [Granulosicoccus sp.]
MPEWLTVCRMFNKIISTNGIPQRLSSDNDPLFRYHQWQVNLRILDVEEIKSIPYTSTSHPFIERLIGTIRREYLDQLFFWNTQDLEQKLAQFAHYYNQDRTHQSHSGITPEAVCNDTQFKSALHERYAWRSHCNGLFQIPIAA